MKIRNLILILLLFFLAIEWSYSQQNVKIKKSEFKVLDMGFSTAWKNVRKGNRNFRENLRGSYQLALDYYRKAYEYNEDNPELNYKLGVSAAILSYPEMSLTHLEKAFKAKEDVANDIHYWMAVALQLNNQFDKAQTEFDLHKSTLRTKQLRKVGADIDKKIMECKTGMELTKNPVRVLVDNLGDRVNSPYPDYAPVFFEPDSVIYFTSRRPDTKGGGRNPLNNEYYEDIYSSRYANGQWGEIYHFPKPINTKRNEAIVSISPSGRELLIYKGGKRAGDIFITGFEKDHWTSLSKLKRRYKINTKKFKETSICFSRDSTKIYFVSNRIGGFGGKDIWYAQKDKTGKWSKPKNMGPKVNTVFDEECIFVGYTDSLLYFSSRGHNSMGGYDIFRSKLSELGEWQEAENMGVPINSAADDMFFTIADNQKTAMFVTTRDGGLGDKDIYSAIFLGPEKQILVSEENQLIAQLVNPEPITFNMEPMSTMKMTVVKGRVIDYTTNQPIEASIEITDNSSKKLFSSVKTNATTGMYQVALPAGKNYGMSVSANGYMFESANFEVADNVGYNEVVKNVNLLPVNPGSKIVLNNTFFDVGKATLQPQSFAELDRLAGYFNLYKNLKVEISGHTDNKGVAQANNKLSKDRAQSVVDYLISKGVAKDKLIAVGQGSKFPVADNKTEDGRKLNRRVEAKILSN